MITISPSLLASNFLNLSSELEALESAQDIWLHLDVMDGHFVPNLTFGHDIIKAIINKSRHPADAHFMVTNPEFYLESLKEIPLHNFTFHLEAVTDVESFILKAKTFFPSIGISLKPGTSVNLLSDQILEHVDLVLVMSVEPGFGGQSFLQDSLQKVAFLKEKKKLLNLSFVIQIDGGINPETAKLAIHAGAENLVAGSAIFKHSSENYNDAITALRS